jgi:hypothetical protein
VLKIPQLDRVGDGSPGGIQECPGEGECLFDGDGAAQPGNPARFGKANLGLFAT